MILIVLREITDRFRDYFVYPDILIYIAAPEMDIFILVGEGTGEVRNLSETRPPEAP
jgi:hypothetical protein